MSEKFTIRRLEVGERINPDTDISCNTDHVIYSEAPRVISEGSRPAYRISIAAPAPAQEASVEQPSVNLVRHEVEQLRTELAFSRGRVHQQRADFADRIDVLTAERDKLAAEVESLKAQLREQPTPAPSPLR